MNKFYSRLEKKEEIKSLRQTLLLAFLSLIIIILIVLFGIPALTKLSDFFLSNKTVIENQDSLPLFSPNIFSLPEATNSAVLSIFGNAPENSNVQIYLNDAQVLTVKTDGSNFKADNLQLTEGTNSLYAVAIDQNEKMSKPSAKIPILYKTTLPELTIKEPENNAHFRGDAQKNQKISGKTDPDSSLTINDHLVILNGNGDFSFSIQLSEGDNLYKIISRDTAGNTTEKEITLSLVESTTTP